MKSESVRTWAEINLDNIIYNYNSLKKQAECNRVMAVIKADAYGSGAVTVAHTLENEGCDYFAVATLDEALQLRRESVKSDILTFGYVDTAGLELAVSHNISITISDIQNAIDINTIAKKLNKKAKIHIKIDTGMTRFGFNYKTACNDILEIINLENVYIEGMYTHFSSADEKLKDYTQIQFENYMHVVQQLNNNNVNIPLKHVANSATTLMYKEMHLDIVRCGISLYGYYPSGDVDKDIKLKPCMSFKTKVVRVQNIEKNVCISYGRKFTTNRESLIATLPIGYADGFSRMLSEKVNIFINGERAKVVGRICMDSCMIDVTDLKSEVNIGDEVEIFGDNIAVEEVAEQLDTINYEVLCMVSKRVPRMYLKQNKVISSKKYI